MAVSKVPQAPTTSTGGVVDKAWFTDQMQRQQISARQLAKKMELDPSALSLVFSGARRLKNEEAAAMALHLGVSLADVLSHAGVNMAGVARPTISVPVPSGRVVRVELPPGLTPKEWDLVSTYLGQFVSTGTEKG